MSVYFVNCDDLLVATAIRHLAGRWCGENEYWEFHGVKGATLCWFSNRSLVFARGENVEELIECVPELVPWEEAMFVVGERLEGMRERLRALEDENANLRKRVCQRGRRIEVRWSGTYEDLQSLLEKTAGQWFDLGDHKQFSAESGLVLNWNENTSAVFIDGEVNCEIKTELAQLITMCEDLFSYLISRKKSREVDNRSEPDPGTSVSLRDQLS
jgi:hypothetical protein